MPTKLDDTGRHEWEPEQTIFNLQLNNPIIQNRALAQDLRLGYYPNALNWLSINNAQREALVEPFDPILPSSSYLPFLYTYALCVTGGIIPNPSELMISGIFDITQAPFNGRGTYVSPADHGYDNGQAIDDAIDAANQTEYGGLVLIPGGKFFSSRQHTFQRGDVGIGGIGRRISRLYHEPTFYNGQGFLRFNSAATGNNPGTTITRNFVQKLSIFGDDPDLMSVAARNARHAKYAIEGICTSGLYLDFDLDFWNTGSTYYGTEGASEAYRSRGKELTYVRMDAGQYWLTDRPVHIMQNPKESNNQIDCDMYVFHNSYLQALAGGPEYCMKIDKTLNVIRLAFTGSHVWTGGTGGLELIEEVGEGLTDASNWFIENLAMEQMAGGSSIKIQKKDGQALNGFEFRNVNCNFVSTEGFNLHSAINGRITGGSYAQYGNQTTSPKAVKLAGTIKRLKFESFMVPSVVSNGADLIDEGPATSTRVTTDRTSAGTDGNQLDTICIYNS